jgi:FKBP-type peptidyl-prolyl cis-trans isomerase SlyD
MSAIESPISVGDDVVVTLDYTLTVDGEIIDTSEGHEPIQFIQGQGDIITGLERGLYGMVTGESKVVAVAAADGYGELDPAAFADIPRNELPPQIPLKPGVKLNLKDKDGETLQAHIDSVQKKTVRLNFNHPLAGKDLRFSVKVVELRPATQDEIEHGVIQE